MSSHKIVIVTGGSSGIGKALVLKYAQKGYTVVFSGRDEERLKEVSLLLGAAPHTYLQLDVANREDNEKLVQETINRYGRIDALICNAGISMRGLFEDIELEVFRRVMEINFFGTIYLVKYALPYLLKSQGSILGISSINGWRSTPARSAYSASKFAIQGFFETLRTEVMDRNVHVLVVCPGFTNTNIRKTALNEKGEAQQESPRDESKMMTAEEVAEETYRAHQDKKRDLILTKQGKMAVFFNKIFPSWIDRKVIQMMKKEEGSPLK